jgi:hypothetical protein
VNNVVIQRTTIVNVHDVRVYRNAGVHRAVVAMPPDRFGRARVQDARVTQIDTRRLQPVRGPLRAVPESTRRAEPSGPRASEPTARSPRLSPGAPPDVRGESPRERRRDGTTSREAAPSAAPRPEPRRIEPAPPRAEPEGRRGESTPPVVQPERRPSDRTPPRVEAAPRRPEPVPPRAAPEPRRESTPPRVAPEPRRAEPPPRVEPPRSQMPPRIDSPPVLAPRVERPRPVLRPGDEPPPRAAERPSVERRERSERRAAPGAAAPALRGAAARERPGRGGQPGAR